MTNEEVRVRFGFEHLKDPDMQAVSSLFFEAACKLIGHFPVSTPDRDKALDALWQAKNHACMVLVMYKHQNANS